MSSTRKEVEYIVSNRSYVFRCPHCDCYTREQSLTDFDFGWNLLSAYLYH
jgi:hypothetical protein